MKLTGDTMILIAHVGEPETDRLVVWGTADGYYRWECISGERVVAFDMPYQMAQPFVTQLTRYIPCPTPAGWADVYGNAEARVFMKSERPPSVIARDLARQLTAWAEQLESLVKTTTAPEKT